MQAEIDSAQAVWSEAILPKAQGSEAVHALSCLLRAQKPFWPRSISEAVWSVAT